MHTIGIDPGIAITGVAIVEEIKGKQTLIFATEINTSPIDSTPQRLEKLFVDTTNILKKYSPDVMALESLFFNTNAKTALIVGQARGVIQLASSLQNIPITEYTPLQVKMALTGYGRADKTQIQQMVKQILKLTKILTPDDVADAAAIALTHCFSYKLINLKSQSEKLKTTA